MKFFTPLFRHRNKGEQGSGSIQNGKNPQGNIHDDTVIECGDAMPQYSKAESTIIELLQEILNKIDNNTSTNEDSASTQSPSTLDERSENVTPIDNTGIQIPKQFEKSDALSSTLSLQTEAIEALCNKILSWEERKDVISSLTPIDVINFVINDSKQILHILNIPTISEDKKFDISRHEPVELNGKIPRPGSEIERIVEDGFELNGKTLIRAKVTLK